MQPSSLSFDAFDCVEKNQRSASYHLYPKSMRFWKSLNVCIPTEQLKLICETKRWGKLCLDEVGKHHFHFQWFLLGSLGAQCEVFDSIWCCVYPSVFKYGQQWDNGR